MVTRACAPTKGSSIRCVLSSLLFLFFFTFGKIGEISCAVWTVCDILLAPLLAKVKLAYLRIFVEPKATSTLGGGIVPYNHALDNISSFFLVLHFFLCSNA